MTPHITRARRPRDAATLIIVKKDGPVPLVLMGQRHQAHAFMPGKFVFPGGGVSPSDTRITPATHLRKDVEMSLRTFSRRANVEALALAAIRETFEETGLAIGVKRTSPLKRMTRSPEWRPFYACGVEPTLDKIEFIARAVTPAARSRRFDARFFLADANLIQGDVHDTSEASGELLDLKWLTFSEAGTLDLPHITRVVLSLVEKRLAENTALPSIPFLRFHRNRMQIDYL